MALNTEYRMRGVTLTRLEEERIDRQVKSLEKRVANFPDPRLEMAFDEQVNPRVVKVDLRLALGPLGGHLVSHQEGPSPDVASKAAIGDVKRQLERRLANQRGEATYGVPSRRLPAEQRPSGQVEDDDELDEFEETPGEDA
ncbi:MAG: hypothetical protein IT335_03625 [Thermomicrobiales bacterium]|nr:hypothetical protein [Thermomicrobiales bacterium]